jgi:hypothetical protein
MDSRNRLLGFAALAFGAAFAVEAIEHAVRLSDILGVPHPGELVVAECLAIAELLLVVLGAGIVAQSLLRSEVRRGLRDGALVVAAAYGFRVLSHLFTLKLAFSEANSSHYRAHVVLYLGLSILLLVAALVAALGLSRSSRPESHRYLGWAGIAYMAANLLGLAAGVIESEGYLGGGAVGALTAGLNLSTTAYLAAAVAGAVAAFAFFDAARGDGDAGAIGRRDLVLAASAGALVLFHLVDGIGESVVAAANSSLGLPTLPSWLAAFAAFVESTAAVCIVAALQPSFAAALQRLRQPIGASEV